MQGASVTFVLRIIGTGLAFGFNVMLARVLGASGTGTFYLGMTVLSIALVFGRLGLDNTVVRFTSIGAFSADWGSVKGVFRNSTLLALGASVLASFAMYALSGWLALDVFEVPELESVIRWLALAVIPMSLLAHHSSALKGLKRVGWAAIVQPQQGGVLVSALALGALLVLGSEMHVVGVSQIYLGATVLATAAAVGIWRTIAPQTVRAVANFPIRDLLQSSIPLFWVTLAHLTTAWVPIAVLGIYGATSDVGVFSIAFRTAALTAFVLLAISSIAAPKFATLYAENRTEELQDVVSTTTMLMVVATLPILAVFFFAPEQVLSLFGDEFEAEGANVLRVLALGQFVNVATGSTIHLLMMAGRERLLRATMFAGAALCVVINFLLIPTWGLMGAAVATTIAIISINLYQVHLARKHLNINPIPWTRFILRQR